MKSLLIFGATGGTGAWVLKYAQHMNLPCTLLVRKQEDADIFLAFGHQVVVGDACSKEDVALACQLAGAECTIVSTMGGGCANYEGHRHIIDSAEEVGIKRMVLVTSLGCGDTWPNLSERGKAAFGFSVREKSLAEMWLQTSTLDYCILRPGGLKNGEPTGRAQCYKKEEVHGFIYRSDLATVVMKMVNQPKLEGQIYSVVDPSL